LSGKTRVIGRRCFTATLAAMAASPSYGSENPVVRLGILPFGTVQWVATIIQLHRLDQAHGFVLQTTRLANTEAAKVALMGDAVDVAVSDWPFVAAQRSHGGTLTFSPFSSSLGGIMVPAGSRMYSLADLRGKRLGVAGGPADKSWLILRAAALKQGIDLTKEASLSFGAPPLLSATLQHGGLDALLTFWNFAARLQAGGFTEAMSVGDCARILGLDAAPVLVGYVFDALWATANPQAIRGFLAASAAACGLLAADPAAWAPIRPLMDAPDPRLFEILRARFLAGIGRPDADTLTAQARRVLAATGAGAALPDGVFWHGA
jgi:NitT/TauT family transport system substrate-binding protein